MRREKAIERSGTPIVPDAGGGAAGGSGGQGKEVMASRLADRHCRLDIARGGGPGTFEALGEFGSQTATLAHGHEKRQHLFRQFALLGELVRSQVGEIPTLDFDALGGVAAT